MRCFHCRRDISKSELGRAEVIYDDAGRLLRATHARCVRAAGKQAALAELGAQPTVYEMDAYRAGGSAAVTAAREARAAVEAERAADPGWSPRPWNDWREQAEADVEALARPERAPEQDPLGFGDLVEETAPE